MGPSLLPGIPGTLPPACAAHTHTAPSPQHIFAAPPVFIFYLWKRPAGAALPHTVNNDMPPAALASHLHSYSGGLQAIWPVWGNQLETGYQQCDDDAVRTQSSATDVDLCGGQDSRRALHALQPKCLQPACRPPRLVARSADGGGRVATVEADACGVVGAIDSIRPHRHLHGTATTAQRQGRELRGHECARWGGSGGKQGGGVARAGRGAGLLPPLTLYPVSFSPSAQ